MKMIRYFRHFRAANPFLTKNIALRQISVNGAARTKYTQMPYNTHWMQVGSHTDIFYVNFVSLDIMSACILCILTQFEKQGVRAPLRRAGIQIYPYSKMQGSGNRPFPARPEAVPQYFTSGYHFITIAHAKPA
ncbi:hypothetical protein D3Z52_07590 [Clostridiaceae bacterium]|nr:hypothetical protein [Clostridiaceae bacterium]